MKGKLLYAEYEHVLIGNTYEDLLDKNIQKPTVTITGYSENMATGERLFLGSVYRCGKLQNKGMGFKAEFMEKRIENGTFKLIKNENTKLD